MLDYRLYFRMELKKQAIEYHEKRVQKQSEERAKVKAEQNRWALRRAMDVRFI